MHPSTMVARFLRQGGEGVYTKVFSRMDPEVQRSVYNEIEFGQETPILAYLQDDYWVIVTMESLYIKDKVSGIRQFKFKECKGISYTIPENRSTDTSGLDFHKLATRCSGERVVIAFERGRPFQGMFQVLHWLIPFV